MNLTAYFYILVKESPGTAGVPPQISYNYYSTRNKEETDRMAFYSEVQRVA